VERRHRAERRHLQDSAAVGANTMSLESRGNNKT